MNRQLADEAPSRRIQHAAGLSLSPGVLEQFRVIHSSRAGGHASKAAETKIHFLRKDPARFKLIVSNRPHQRDASPRTVALELGCVVGWAGGQAQTAMHALLHYRVVQTLEVRSIGFHWITRISIKHFARI